MKSIDIVNLANKSFKKKIVTLTCADKTYDLSIEEHFRETTILELVDEMRERSQYCLKHEIKFDMMQTLYILMIKKFTDIKFSQFKAVEKQYAHELDVVKSLIDLGLFTQIIQAFDSKEVDKIGVYLERYKENMKIIANTVLAQEMEKEQDGEV